MDTWKDIKNILYKKSEKNPFSSVFKYDEM